MADHCAHLESIAERLEDAAETGLTAHETAALAARIRRMLEPAAPGAISPEARRAFLASSLLDHRGALTTSMISTLLNRGIDYVWQMAERPTGYKAGERNGFIRLPGVGRVTYDACLALLMAHGCSFGMADDPDVVALRAEGAR
jgi:hypothetical protein